MTESGPVGRVVLGGVALAGGLLAFVATFLPWITTDTEDGGTTSITGCFVATNGWYETHGRTLA